MLRRRSGEASNKDYDLSLNFIQKTRKINKNNQMAIYHIGLINMALNNYLEAEKDFKELNLTVQRYKVSPFVKVYNTHNTIFGDSNG